MQHGNSQEKTNFSVKCGIIPTLFDAMNSAHEIAQIESKEVELTESSIACLREILPTLEDMLNTCTAFVAESKEKEQEEAAGALVLLPDSTPPLLFNCGISIKNLAQQSGVSWRHLRIPCRFNQVCNSR